MFGGYPPTAIGYPPTAIGYTPTAIGYTPTAIGYPPTAIGYPPTAIGYPPTAIGYPPTAIGYPPTAIGYPPTAIGYTPTAIGYPPTAISYPPAAIVGRIGHSEFFFFIMATPGADSSTHLCTTMLCNAVHPVSVHSYHRPPLSCTPLACSSDQPPVATFADLPPMPFSGVCQCSHCRCFASLYCRSETQGDQSP